MGAVALWANCAAASQPEGVAVDQEVFAVDHGLPARSANSPSLRHDRRDPSSGVVLTVRARRSQTWVWEMSKAYDASRCRQPTACPSPTERPTCPGDPGRSGAATSRVSLR